MIYMERRFLVSLIFIIILAVLIPKGIFNDRLLDIGSWDSLSYAKTNSSPQTNQNANQLTLNTFQKNISSEITNLMVWVTAYTSAPEETDNTPFITASNELVRDGIVAANFLPFGTQIKIPSLFGNKIFVVEDRMKKDKDNYVDIWMSDLEKAKNFGVHRAKILILGQGINIANAETK